MGNMVQTPEERSEKNRQQCAAYYAANREKSLARQKAYNEANKDKQKAYNAARYAANREKFCALSRAQHAANKSKVRETKRKYRENNWEKLAADRRRRAGLPEATRPQPDSCECCRREFGFDHSTYACSDHCHISHTFRGWICGDCNRGLGLLGESIEGLMNAVRYLQRAVIEVQCG